MRLCGPLDLCRTPHLQGMSRGDDGQLAHELEAGRRGACRREVAVEAHPEHSDLQRLSCQDHVVSTHVHGSRHLQRPVNQQGHELKAGRRSACRREVAIEAHQCPNQYDVTKTASLVLAQAALC